jgi:hypothetical protein
MGNIRKDLVYDMLAWIEAVCDKVDLAQAIELTAIWDALNTGDISQTDWESTNARLLQILALTGEMTGLEAPPGENLH